MSNPNDRQVGGSHYKNKTYQHWDWAVDVGLLYLEGYSTKYVVRWREKGGIRDLEKVIHIIEKLISIVKEGRVGSIDNKRGANIGTTIIKTDEFVKINTIPETESLILRYIACWATEEDLLTAKTLTQVLIDKAKTTVPLTEENHYTERFNYDDRS